MGSAATSEFVSVAAFSVMDSVICPGFGGKECGACWLASSAYRMRIERASDPCRASCRASCQVLDAVLPVCAETEGSDRLLNGQQGGLEAVADECRVIE